MVLDQVRNGHGLTLGSDCSGGARNITWRHIHMNGRGKIVMLSRFLALSISLTLRVSHYCRADLHGGRRAYLRQRRRSGRGAGGAALEDRARAGRHMARHHVYASAPPSDFSQHLPRQQLTHGLPGRRG